MTKSEIKKKYHNKIFDWTEPNDPFEIFMTGKYIVTLTLSYSWDGTFATSGCCRCFSSLSAVAHSLRIAKVFK